MAKKKTIYKYKDWILDSQGEVDFCYYLEELQESGYIQEFKRGETLELSRGLNHWYDIHLKTKIKKANETIFREHVYTYDFKIEWSEKGKELFVNTLYHGKKWEKPFLIWSDSISYIECKPSNFDFNNMTRLVKLNIKWVWEKYNFYVQLIENEKLFKETFVPKKLLLTKTGKTKTFKFPVKTLEEYIKSVENDKTT